MIEPQLASKQALIGVHGFRFAGGVYVVGGVWKKFRRWPTLVCGIVLLGILVLLAIFAPWISHFDPLKHDLVSSLKPPSMAHWFGTDNFGRDIFSRSLHALRLDLAIGIFGVCFAFMFGVFFGVVAGFCGGWLENFIMRLVDVFFAFPFAVLMIAMISILGPGIQNMIVAFTLSGWGAYARIARAETLVVKRTEYIAASEALGMPIVSILARHVVPNIISAAVVFSVADVVLVILSAASLSFLGLGVAPPTPELGAMISEGRSFILFAWWPVTLPGLVIVTTAIALSLVGDGVSELLRPTR